MSLLNLYNSYKGEKSGAIAVIFALSLSVLISCAGIATDLAVAYNAKNRLMNALDKAALAVGSSAGDEAELSQIMEKLFYANYDADSSFGTPFDLELTITGENIIDVSASVRVNTMFMSMFGKTYLEVSASSQVIRELAGIEAVLVLDVTGSMAGSNITALRTASSNFINIMFDRISDEEYLKIGIVPYAASVNVGRYGIGQNPDGSYYGTSFVSNPSSDDYVSPASNIQFGTATNAWWGCIRERTLEGEQMTDASSPNWHMYRYPRVCLRSGWWGCTQYATPNYGCNTSIIVPLINNRSTLLNSISNLVVSGNTYSHLGMVWGWRVISPEFPFMEGVEYDNRKWNKIVILMTDGDNTVGYYSGEGLRGDTGVSATVLQENQKLAQVCEDMKEQGIKVYTITFQSGISETTKGYYRNCATSTSMYYDAPDAADLINVFERIADQLSKLHVAK